MLKFTDFDITSFNLRAMEVCTRFSKFASPEVGEELAHLGVPEGAGHVVALGGGADVHDVLFPAVSLVLAKSRLVKLADGFVSHFSFYFSEI